MCGALIRGPGKTLEALVDHALESGRFIRVRDIRHIRFVQDGCPHGNPVQLVRRDLLQLQCVSQLEPRGQCEIAIDEREIGVIQRTLQLHRFERNRHGRMYRSAKLPRSPSPVGA